MDYKHRPYADVRDALTVAHGRGTFTHDQLDQAAADLASSDPANHDPYAVVVAASADCDLLEWAEDKARDDYDDNDSALCHISNVAWCVLYHQYYTRLETDLGLYRPT